MNVLVIYIELKSGKNIEDEMIISNSYFLHHSLPSAFLMTILQRLSGTVLDRYHRNLPVPASLCEVVNQAMQKAEKYFGTLNHIIDDLPVSTTNQMH